MSKGNIAGQPGRERAASESIAIPSKPTLENGASSLKSSFYVGSLEGWQEMNERTSWMKRMKSRKEESNGSIAK